MELNSLLVKLLGVEDQLKASYSDGSLFFHFSNINICFNILNKSWAKVYPRKNKNISEKRKLKNKFNPIKGTHFIKRNDLQTRF